MLNLLSIQRASLWRRDASWCESSLCFCCCSNWWLWWTKSRI